MAARDGDDEIGDFCRKWAVLLNIIVTKYIERLHHLQMQVAFLFTKTEVMRIGKDIFEDVRAAVGCEYISDLTRRKAEAIKAIGSIDLKAYPDEQITAFRRYVCRKD